VVDFKGIGKPMNHSKSDPVLKIPQFHPCDEISVVLEAVAVDEVVDMIEKTQHTGSRSDGKFFILPVEEAVRLHTGERGKQALC
jgi:nitrogen regulatory protein P-II 1